MQKQQPVFFTESSKNLGGQELQLVQQMLELGRRGIETALFCRNDSAIYTHALQLGLRVVSTRFRNALDVRSIYTMYSYLLKDCPSTVICHSGHDSIISALAVKLYRCISFGKFPRVIRMRTYQPGVPSAFPYNVLFDKTYTPSNYLRKQILANRKIKPDQIDVLYPGIDFSRLDSSAFERLPEDLVKWLERVSGPLLVHGAMLRAEKGHSIILEALESLKVEMPNIHYLIVGDGPLRAELESMVRVKGLEQLVYFTGFIPNIGDVLRYATLAVFPSIYDPLGMFQIEAQYLCIPTLAHNIGGIPETIQNNLTGRLVESGEPRVWCCEIKQLLLNEGVRQRYSENSRQYVLKKFSVERNTGRLIEICLGRGA